MTDMSWTYVGLPGVPLHRIMSLCLTYHIISQHSTFHLPCLIGPFKTASSVNSADGKPQLGANKQQSRESQLHPGLISVVLSITPIAYDNILLNS